MGTTFDKQLRKQLRTSDCTPVSTNDVHPPTLKVEKGCSTVVAQFEEYFQQIACACCATRAGRGTHNPDDSFLEFQEHPAAAAPNESCMCWARGFFNNIAQLERQQFGSSIAEWSKRISAMQ